MLQECLSIPVDGVFGPQTLEHTNAYNPTMLAAALRAAQADFYRAIVALDPTKGRFLGGWLARAARIYPS
jgi:lysozyme family protein